MSPAGRTIVRFAPSPNGYLHLGHAYSALANDAVARKHAGTMLVRIEDIDLGRSRPAYETAIFEDLAWLGIAYAEPVRRQAEHFDDYRAALARLDQLGCCYPCFCSRADTFRAMTGDPGWPRDPDGEPVYPGTCKALPAAEVARRIAEGQPAARRLDGERARALLPEVTWQELRESETPRTVVAQPQLWGDAVIARKDVPTSYTLAVVVDDALQGITDVVRGEDLYAATGLQRLVAGLLGLPAPRYRHHRLLRDASGAKLSKRLASTTLRALREAGISAQDLRRQLGFP